MVLPLAALARVAAWGEWSQTPLASVAVLDPAWHRALGERIAAGDWAAGSTTWMVSPGPAWLAAAGSILGLGSVTAGAAVQLTIGVGAVEVVRRLGLRAGGPAAAAVAGWAAALSGPWIFHDLALLTVSPAALGLGLAVAGVLRAGEAHIGEDDGGPHEGLSAGLLVAAGLALAGAAWFRPNLLLVAPALALASGFHAASGRRCGGGTPPPHDSEHALEPDAPPLPALVENTLLPRAARFARAGLLVALGVFLGLSPALVRNRIVGGEWVLLSANAGANLAMAQAPGLDANFPPGGTAVGNLDVLAQRTVEEASRALGRSVRPAEADAWWRAKAVAGIWTEPGAAAWRTLRRFGLALGSIDVQDHQAYHAQRARRTVLGWLPDVAFLLPGLSLAGLAAGWFGGTPAERRSRRLLAATWLVGAASLAPFVVVERYRAPLLVVQLPLAASALVAILSWTREAPRWHGIALRAALARAAVLALCLLGAVDPFLHDGHVRWVIPGARQMAHALGRDALPGPVVDPLTAEGPARAAAESANLAAQLVRAGRLDDAAAAYAEVPVRDHAPADAQAAAALLVQLGRVDEAAALASRAVDAHPTDAGLTALRCGVLLRLPTRAVEAAHACEAARALAPERWEAWYQAGLAAWQVGRLDVAVQRLESALRARPGAPEVLRALADVRAQTTQTAAGP